MPVKASTTKAAELSGRVLYRYLHHELREHDVWMYQALAARLVADLGIWFSPKIYDCMPILLPHVIRDEGARGRKGSKESWGAPNAQGYVRDDNSLIKELPKSLVIDAPAHRHYKGKKIGRAGGWVASHVWRQRNDGSSTNKHWATNSFIANLVWLPEEVSKLTDHEGSFVQRYTQALAHKIYASRTPHGALAKFARLAWGALDLPTEQEIPPQSLPSLDELNFFMPSDRWMVFRRNKLRQMLEVLQLTAEGKRPTGRVSPTRWVRGLKRLEPAATRKLRTELALYVAAIDAAL